MTEKLVSRETAVALNDAGFDEYCRTAIHIETGKTSSSSWPDRNSKIIEGFLTCPTLSHACQWLRSKGLHMVVVPDVLCHGNKWVWHLYKMHGKYWKYQESSRVFPDHDSALEAGIIRAIEELKNDNK